MNVCACETFILSVLCLQLLSKLVCDCQSEIMHVCCCIISQSPLSSTHPCIKLNSYAHALLSVILVSLWGWGWGGWGLHIAHRAFHCVMLTCSSVQFSVVVSLWQALHVVWRWRTRLICSVIAGCVNRRAEVAWINLTVLLFCQESVIKRYL